MLVRAVSIQERAAAAFVRPGTGVGGLSGSLLEFLLLPYSGIAPVLRLGDDRRMELRTEVIRLLQRAQAHTQDRPVMSGADVEASPVTCPVFELGEQIVRTISTVMKFETAIEVTTSQLRIELMF